MRYFKWHRPFTSSTLEFVDEEMKIDATAFLYRWPAFRPEKMPALHDLMDVKEGRVSKQDAEKKSNYRWKLAK